MRALRREYRGSFGDVYLKGAFQWQVSYFTRGGKKEIGLVDHQRPVRPGARTVDRLSGRVDDGARLPRRVRQARQRAVHLAAAVRAVHAAVLQLPQAVLAAAPGPARAAVVLGLAGVLQPRAHLRVGAAEPTRRCCTCWRACSRCCGVDPAPRSLARPPPRAAPARARALAGARRGVPARLSHRPQRHRLERRSTSATRA